MILRRTQHTTDTKLAGQLARRTIKNWSNYRTPAGLWLSTDPAVEAVPGVPDDWEGPDFNFSKHVTRGPLQLYFGDTSDPDNTTMIGARLSDDPRKWIQVQAVGVAPGVPMSDADVERKVRWSSAWKNTDLVYQAKPSGFEWFYELLKLGCPDVFDADIRFPPGCSMVPDGDGARFLDDKGDCYAKMPPPWGVDANEESIGVKMSFGALSSELSGDGVQTVSFAVDKDDLASAVYPVTVGPTVKIEGTTDLEDNRMHAGANEFKNWGGSLAYNGMIVGVAGGATDIIRTLFRVKSNAIPAGSITGARVKCYRIANGQSDSGDTVVCFTIKDANDWVEGTVDATVQVGSSCYRDCKRAAQDWAGHPTKGCGVSGVDHDATAVASQAYGAYNSGPDVPFTFEFNAAGQQAVIDWRDSLRVDNGVLIRALNESPVQSRFDFHNTEAPSSQVHFEIDYGAAGGDRSHSMARGIGRGIGRGLG